MPILAPSILAADFSNLQQQIRMVEIGGADWIHCDVMDGHFVPNLTFGPILIKAARKSTTLPLNVHLMVERPYNSLEDYAEAGADHIIIHYEAVTHLKFRAVTKIKELGLKVGVALNPSTPVSLLKNIVEYLDSVLIMSVNPGFGGQSFIPNTLLKINEAVNLRKELNANYLIEVDGGINKDNIKSILKAGCDVFVSGSSIFHQDNVSAAAAELRNLIKED